MSDNPLAFDAVRKAAYAWANMHGKEEDGLRKACTAELRRLRESGVISSAFTAAEGEQLVQDVVLWTLKRYNPPRPKPKRHREERASTYLLTPAVYEEVEKIDGKATLRGTARITDQSKSTVGRHMMRQGTAPRRDRKIAALSKSSQRLIAILDSTFDRRHSGIMKQEWLIEALWPTSGSREPTSRTTRKSRETRLKALAREVTNAGVGYRFVFNDGICGVMRGRRFPGPKDTLIWMQENARLKRFVGVIKPPLKPKESGFFWEDAVLKDVFTIMDMSRSGSFYPFERMSCLFRFKHFLLDPTPILMWLERAYDSDTGPDIGANLVYLADNIFDETTRKAVRKLGMVLDRLQKLTSPLRDYHDTFMNVDDQLQIMQYCRDNAPQSYPRLAYVQEMLAAQDYSDLDVLDWYQKMIDAEKAGHWVAPEAAVLHRYSPSDQEVDVR